MKLTFKPLLTAADSAILKMVPQDRSGRADTKFQASRINSGKGPTKYVVTVTIPRRGSYILASTYTIDEVNDMATECSIAFE